MYFGNYRRVVYLAQTEDADAAGGGPGRGRRASASPTSTASPGLPASPTSCGPPPEDCPMADKVVVYWRDIPAQVIVKAGRKTAKRQLAERFEQAIDRAAMRAKLTGTDAYLEQWRRADPVPCGDDLEAEAATAAEALGGRVHARAPARAGRQRRQRCLSRHVRRPPLVDPPRRLLGSVLPALRARLGRGGAAVAARRPRPSGSAGRRDRAQREGLPVRLPDVRHLRAQLDRHVLPDELPEADAQRALRRRPRRRSIARSSQRCAASGCRPGKARGAWRRATASPSVRPPVDHRRRGSSAWLRVVRERLG